MQDTETDPVLAEHAVGDAIHLEDNPAAGLAADRAVPGEIDLTLPVLDFEFQAERVSENLRAQIGNAVGDGSPIGVPDRTVHAAHDIALAQADVTQAAFLKPQRQR